MTATRFSPDELLTVAEVAAELKCSEQVVREELRRKNLRGIKLGGQGGAKNHRWRVLYADLRTYMDANANVSRVRKAAS